ncbi:DUF445 domain-containing protein [Paenibacillus sp. GCM10027627]|uniref:DUF445 domain-containing protein n=1 Tax=unclassified Paenibacillus TaxID=185978 RepID=UPI003642B4F0
MTMRKKANLSLILLAILFVAAAVCLYVYPGQWWSRLLLYTAEAGLVGALADWFAVTVLFRHPFGLKWFPHTAIIPRNRNKLVEGVAAMVEEQLLSKGLIKEKLMEFSIVDSVIEWLDGKQGERPAAERSWQLLLALLRKINPDGVSQKLDRHAREALLGVNLSPYAGKALRWVLENSDFQKWLGHLVDYAAERASSEETKLAIRAMLTKEKDKFVNEGGSITRWFKKKLVDFAEAADAINFDDAAATLNRDLQSFMVELRNPDHEIRQLIEKRIYELADILETSEDIAAAIEAWKRQLLEQVSFQPSIRALIESIRDMLISHKEMKYVVVDEAPLKSDDIKEWIVNMLDRFWNHFKSDEAAKGQLDGYLKGFIGGIIEQEHAIIGKIARKTLEGFTEERLVQFIESKVEPDLQRIRLNGAVIGAAVGALLFLFLQGVYAPILEWL